MNKTILLVDDEKEILELLRLYLEKDGYSVILAQNGAEALGKAKVSKPHLAVVDIMMPEMDGYQLIGHLRKSETGDIPIIVLSAKGEAYERILGLDLGADDYVTKPFDPMEVLARIKAQLRRCKEICPKAEHILSLGRLRLDTDACQLLSENEEVSLTATEYRMMEMLMQNPGRVFTKQQIYETAWQENVVVDNNTVMVAISKLRGKLPLEAGVSITTIRGLGYRLEAKR